MSLSNPWAATSSFVVTMERLERMRMQAVSAVTNLRAIRLDGSRFEGDS
jgi:hypothetical protein